MNPNVADYVSPLAIFLMCAGCIGLGWALGVTWARFMRESPCRFCDKEHYTNDHDSLLEKYCLGDPDE